MHKPVNDSCKGVTMNERSFKRMVSQINRVNRCSSEVALMDMLRNNSVDIRQLVAKSMYATPDILLLALQDKNHTVRACAAGNPNANEDVLLVAVCDIDFYVCHASLRNKNATPRVFAKGLICIDRQIRFSANEILERKDPVFAFTAKSLSLNQVG